MTRTFRLTVVSVGLVLIAACVLADYDPRLLLVDWQDTSRSPASVTEQIEIANGPWLLKKQSFSLTCSLDGIRFVYRFRMIVADRSRIRPGDDNPYVGPMVLVGRWPSGRWRSDITVPGRIVAYGRVDTIVSMPVPTADLQSLEQWLAAPAPVQIGIDAGENGRRVIARVTSVTVEDFVSRCEERRTR